jgi:release factor glutamine methyltransferase
MGVKHVMTLGEALKHGTDALKKAGIETAVTDAIVLLSHATGMDRAYLYTHGDRALSDREKEEYLESIEKRMGNMPVAYITGVREFMSLDFFVRPGVLIPRPETELLAETVIDFVKESGAPSVSILDLGTGSGCIAVSLAYYIGNCRVTAVDISEEALEVAQLNAEKNMVAGKIEFLRGDFFEPLRGSKFDIIASNPPYIPSGDIAGLGADVRDFEPVAALDGGADGLDFHRKIIREAKNYLTKNGFLVLEAGRGQADAIARLMNDYYHDIKVYGDIQGIPRVVAGRLYTKITSKP